MRFGDSLPPRRRNGLPHFLLASLVLHAALGAALYWFGSYQVELRRQDEQVAASVRATTHMRSARRVEDLQKIKELMEQSANREPEPAAPAGTLAAREPEELLRQARTLARDIEELGRDIKAEELAELTGVTKEEARAEVDADAQAAPPQAPAPKAPAEEIAQLEAQAREILARRAEALQRRQDGVAVGMGEQPSGAGGPPGGDPGAYASNGGPAGRAAGDVAARIADFVRSDGAGEGAGNVGPSRGYTGLDVRFFDPGGGNIPAVRPGWMVKAQGRMLGAGGQYANRIYLNSWYLIGPFAGRHGRGIFNNPKYPPEDAVLLDAVYYGKDKRLLKWEYFNASSYPLIPRDAAEDAVYYGYTEVLMDQERDLMVWIGADDDAQVYVNDKLVWKGGNVAKQGFFSGIYDVSNTHVRDYNRTEGKTLVRFRKGRNKVFFKLSNGPTRIFLSMVLTLPDVR